MNQKKYGHKPYGHSWSGLLEGRAAFLMAEAWKWIIKIYTGNHGETLNGKLLNSEVILYGESGNFASISSLANQRFWIGIIFILWQFCVAILLGVQGLKMAILSLCGPPYVLYQSGTWQTFQMQKKKVSNMLLHCLVKCVFCQVYLDPHICLLSSTSKQSISAGHSWHCLSVLSTAKEREDIRVLVCH